MADHRQIGRHHIPGHMNIFDLLDNSQIVVISPHPDDVAFSVGGLITRLKKTQVVMITCFTQSCINDRNDSSVITEIRSREDDAYAQSIQARLIRLGLPDTSVRTNRNKEDLYADKEERLRLELAALLKSVISKLENAAVFVPLAIGDHLDHIHCRQVALDTLTGQTLIFYEDLPYGQFIGGPDNVKRVVLQQYPHFREINIDLTTEQIERKMQGLDLYKSQVHWQWRLDIENYARALGTKTGSCGERYWTSSDQHQPFYRNNP